MKGPRLLTLPRRAAVGFAVLGNVVPIAIAVATRFESHRPVFFIGAAFAVTAPLVVTTASRNQPVPFYLAAFGGLAAFTLMQAYTGGAGSGYSILLMMAMIWFGLQATDRELGVAVLLLMACAYLPMLLVGPPAYPVDWGHASLLVIVGLAVAGSLRMLARETAALTDRLRAEAVNDELTGLLNRRGWREAAARELARADRTGTTAWLATLDLDRLKEINDKLGHAQGDAVLRDTAARMREALRADDMLGRIGGDEFVVLQAGGSRDGVRSAIQRLRDRTPERAIFSAGVAARQPDEELDALLRRADAALYAAKAAGGGTTVFARDASAEATRAA